MGRILRCQCGKFYIPQRFILTLMAFFAVVFSYCNRSCLNVAITRIAQQRNKTTSNVTGPHVCDDPNPPRKHIKGGEYVWTESEQASLLISFFWGYVLGHLPGGILADYYGAKHVLGTGVILSALGSALSPSSIIETDGNPWGLIFIRFIMGLGQGPLIPACSSLIGKWAPTAERSRLGGFIPTGSQFGSVIGNYLTSRLINDFNSWPLPFYFWATLTAIWYLLYLLLCYSEPSQCPNITEEEAAYLEKEIGKGVVKPKIPWGAILTSGPVWAIISISMGHGLIFFFIATQYPKYLDNVLHFNLKEIGLYTSIPFILMWFAANGSAWLSDWLMKKQYCTILTLRKTLCTIGNVLPGLFFMLGIYMGCNRDVAVILFIFCLISMGPYYPSMKVQPADISKNFAGVVMAISNGAGVLMYIPMPHITGRMTKAVNKRDILVAISFPMYIIAVGSTVQQIANSILLEISFPSTRPTFLTSYLNIVARTQ